MVIYLLNLRQMILLLKEYEIVHATTQVQNQQIFFYFSAYNTSIMPEKKFCVCLNASAVFFFIPHLLTVAELLIGDVVSIFQSLSLCTAYFGAKTHLLRSYFTIFFFYYFFFCSYHRDTVQFTLCQNARYPNKIFECEMNGTQSLD